MNRQKMKKGPGSQPQTLRNPSPLQSKGSSAVNSNNHSRDGACVSLTDLKASLTALHRQLKCKLRDSRGSEDGSRIISEDSDGIGSDRDNWMCQFGRYVAVEQALGFIRELESKSASDQRSGGVE